MAYHEVKMSDQESTNGQIWRMPHAEGPLKKILLVEDDRSTQHLCRMGLRGLAGFSILVASNGLEALKFIKEEEIHVLVTDLDMPVMDGFSLIATVADFYPHIPILVMTSLNESQHGNVPLQLGALRIFPKPVRLSLLMEEIRQAALRQSDGMVRGLTLNSLLQLMAWERKDATMVVKQGNETGLLYVKQGEVVHAAYQEVDGLEAAYFILCWDSPTVEFVATCRVNRSIDLPLTELLLNAALLKDTVHRMKG